MSDEKHSDTGTLAVIPATPDTLIALAIERNVAVETLKGLMDMRREFMADEARAAYCRAVSAFQGECPTIEKKRKVMAKTGNSVRYQYANLEDIIGQVGHLLAAHGLSYAFDTDIAEGFLTLTCKISHVLGHSGTSKFRVPVENSGYMTKTQEFGSSSTYGKRYCFCNALGIMTGDEDDDGATVPSPAAPAAAPRPAPAPAPVTPRPPAKAAPPAPAAAAKGDLEAFAVRCMEKFFGFTAAPETAWAWWAYSIQQGWILDTETIRSARWQKVFDCIDPAKSVAENSPGVAARFQSIQEGVGALFDNIPEDQRTGWIAAYARVHVAAPAAPAPAPAAPPRAPAAPLPAPAPRPPATGNACPKCMRTLIGESDEYEGVSDCEACGYQWETATGTAWEAHPWANVLCPIPPKGMKRDTYLKSPMTLGMISRTDSKRFFGLVMNNQEPKGWSDAKGIFHKPSAADEVFCGACKAAVQHIESTKKGNTP